MTLANYLLGNPIELIIFDCDGVLVDSEILSKQTLLKMLNDLGANVSDEYFYTHFLGYNFEHVTAKVLADFSLVLTDEFRFAYRDALLAVFTTELKPTVKLDSMLEKLSVKSCVATSSSPAKVGHALQATALNEYFSGNVFTASEVKNGKPAPDLFLHAANKMGVAAEHCLVIEDSQAGIQGAKAANMRVIRYAGASHLIHHSYHDDVHTITHWDQLNHLLFEIDSDQKVQM
ncbi:HAD family hydrolase [uncultured Paraglaciecola sp.]|uniref:HAD family hydrolase n=1 Tax=uncultured Paraglaciecola sp. TaxID=1765024 RepID=UPI0030DCF7B3|tara:strand:- start:50692 stop:51387 length:696 start_codon:yes stop_codon:yes gene_type:complete